MPLMPNFLERTLFLTLNQGPGVALDLWSGPAFRFVLAAIRLNLFDALVEQPRTAQALAHVIQTDPHATALLLAALESLGYIKRRGELYALTGMSRKWLTDAGTLNFSPFYRYWGVLIEEFFPRLEESIRSGQPPANLYAWLEDHPEVSRDFQAGMSVLTEFVKDDVLKRITLPPTTKRLLDLGGGHGTYSLALCQRYPTLAAVIMDSPQPLVSARDYIDRAGLGSRIATQAGDFLHNDLGSGFDVALLFNVIHGLTAAQNRALLQRAQAALNPGGQVFILEQIPGSTPLPISEATVRILGLSFFHLLGGQCYAFPEIRSWLQDSGFVNVQRKNIPKAGSALIVGTLP
ncbi:MAG TPA: methyltransferase [Caldilineaceae bacterium]|nr:methyltransferase [Caldilineaceae bacterium]HRW09930.1 methyltransferase [Caldilineaceae bacterium]